MPDARSTPPTSDAARIERALESLEQKFRALRVGAPDALRIVEQLQSELPPDLARRAAELFELRRRAAARFPSGALRSLTRKGLEQATREPVARARAQRIAEIAAKRPEQRAVYDATCGLGADAIALLEAGVTVVAGDVELEVARCARDNLARIDPRGQRHCVILANALDAPVRADFLVIDPDRRSRGARSLSGDRWSPNLRDACSLAQRFAGACIKLPPGIDIADVEPWLRPGLPRRWQWVSCARALCELALWTGELAGPAGPETAQREALALVPSAEAGGELRGVRIEGRPLEVGSEPPLEVAEIRWLAEPDPAVIRSGLLVNLARELGLAPLGPRNAFLAGSREPRSELCRAWRVLGVAPADPRRVRAMLAEHDVGPLAILKRGHPDTGEELARKFRGRGSRRGLLAVARLERGHLAFLLDAGDPGERRSEAWVGDEGFEPPTSSV